MLVATGTMCGFRKIGDADSETGKVTVHTAETLGVSLRKKVIQA